MKAFIDFEFSTIPTANLKTGKTNYSSFDLISIGVCTDTQKSFYAISNEFDVDYAIAHSWMRENVLIHIYNQYKHLTKHGFSEKGISEIISIVGFSKREIAIDLYNFLNPHFAKMTDECILDILISSDQNEDKRLLLSESKNIEYIPNQVDFYGWHCEPDWVILCELYRNMGSIPIGFGYNMTNVKQTLLETATSKEDLEQLKSILPENPSLHHPLADAKWTMESYNLIKNIKDVRKK